MKTTILIILFFLFYFISLKDINDSKKFVEENNMILEYEMIEKDSIIMALEKDRNLLNKKIKEMTEIKKIVKQKRKPIVKDTPIVDTLKVEVLDTLKK